MLYRVHRGDAKGYAIAYVQLCHGYVSVSHICQALLEAGIIPANWFYTIDSLNSISFPSPIYGVSAFSLMRRTPAKSLFYLCPIEPNTKQMSPSKWGDGSKWLVMDGDISGSYTIPTSWNVQYVQMPNYVYYEPQPIPAQPPIPQQQAPLPANNHLLNHLLELERERRR